jgi:hypothetical protein
VRPLIFAACDDIYFQKFAGPLMNSAKRHGMECEIINGGTMEPTDAMVLRYRMLPDVLRCRESVLVLDVDSVINDTIHIGERYDLGLFLRNDFKDPRKKVMGSAVYVHRRAMQFAVELRERLAGPCEWFDDQWAIDKLYRKHLGKFHVKLFGTEFINWHCEPALIWTGKGKVKETNERFAQEMERYA